MENAGELLAVVLTVGAIAIGTLVIYFVVSVIDILRRLQ